MALEKNGMCGGLVQGAVRRHRGCQDNASIRLTDNVDADDGVCLTTVTGGRRTPVKGRS